MRVRGEIHQSPPRISEPRLRKVAAVFRPRVSAHPVDVDPHGFQGAAFLAPPRGREATMHISIARYAGAAGKIGAAAPKVQQGFVPLLKNQPGFLGYAAFASEQGDIVALHLWENADALANSFPKIREWVTGNLTGFEQPTERFHGEVGPHAIVEPQSGGQGQSLYCMVRKTENLPSVAVLRPVIEETLAAIQKLPGFRGGYFQRSADDQTRGASVTFYDTREQANSAHEAALAIMHKYQPDVAVRVAASGQTAVLAMG